MNFNDLFKEEIISTYRQLRGGGEDAILSYKNIEGAYTCDPTVFKSSLAMRGRRPIVAMGLDEYYKYVLPVSQAWRNQEGNMITANYLYACQGDRKLSRELLLNNRLLYMDSKWLGGAFTISTGGMAGVMFRSTANHEITTSDKYIDLQDSGELQPGDAYTMETVDDQGNVTRHNYVYQPYGVKKYIDATPQYNVTPYLNFYITTFVDENTFQNDEAFNEEKYPNGMPTKVLDSVTEAYQYGRVDQQLNYFAGSSYISSLGDLSTKYANQVKIPNTPRLLDITLGSDAPDYFNNENLNPFELYTELDDQTGLPKDGALKPLLNKIILSNLRGLNTFLDVRSPDKLTEFRALGTSLTYALFAEGAPLRIVHLPNTVTRLLFIQNKNLTKILKTPPVVADMIDNNLIYRDPTTYEGLYVAGLTDYDPISGPRSQGSPITEIDFEGDAMGYDSYTILNNLVLQKKATTLEERENRLRIKMTDINWTPYTQVEYGESKDANTQYYILTDHSTYEPYDQADSEWATDTLNGKVFTYDTNAPKATISDLSLLDTFLADYADTSTPVNQFTNNTESEMSSKTYPAISGQLFVANGNATTGIGETALSSIYAKAWPNLVIRAEKVEKSYLTKYVEIDPNSGKEIVLDNKAFNDEGTIELPPASRLKVPTRTHYDFKGFSPIMPPRNPSDMEELPELYVVRNAAGNDWELTPAGRSALIDNTTKVQILYAIFTPHPYKMSYYYQDGTLIEIVDSPYSPENGSVKKPSLPPSMDESLLPLNKTYAFLGYSEIQNETTNLVDFNTRKSNRDMTFYAVFEERDAYKLDYSRYFVQNGVVSYIDVDGNSAYNISQGVELTLIPESTDIIIGKIVVPAQWDGLPVCSITGFAQQTHITHILFAENHPLRKIATNCCKNMTSLQYFDFISLKSLRVIDEAAFANVNNFSLVDAIGDNAASVLVRVNKNGFSNAFNSTNRPSSLNVIHLPASIKTLESTAFCPQNLATNANVSLEIGDASHPSQLLMPVVEPNYDLASYQCIGSNGGYQWYNVDFYSAYYDGNVMIKDSNNNDKDKLINYLGLLRDNRHAMPYSFTIYYNTNVHTIIEDRTTYNE